MRDFSERVNHDRSLMGMLDGVKFFPIFIMGDHRTGTTVLYEILEATGCFNIVTAYHILCSEILLYDYLNHRVDERKEQLAAYFEQKGLTDRGIDRVSATPDTPEEYGFILPDGGHRPQLAPENLDSFVEFCQKLQLVSHSRKSLLLKNPWDFLNFAYVKEAFPESKFIFIHRNPVDTIDSQLRATRSLFDTRNEYVALMADWYDSVFSQPFRLRLARFMFSSHFHIGLRIVTRHVTLATSYFVNHVAQLPQEDYVSVKYEDLCDEPSQTITEILKWLGLSEQRSVDYGSLISTRDRSLLDEVQEKRFAIRARLRPYLEYCGYESGVGLS